MKHMPTFLVLFITLGCTNSYNVQFRLDERYFNAIPQYQEGRSYINSNFDTLTFALTSVENNWPIVAYDPSEDRNYSIQQKKYNYTEENNPDLDFYIIIRSYPDLERNTVAGTELECVWPSGVLRLIFLASDTSAVAPSTYIGNYTVQGNAYEHVYGDPSIHYYSADGELLKFKLNNDVWYELLPE